MYKDVINTFFSLHDKNIIHYYCIVIDNSKMDHKKYNEGDKEIGFNKMLFTLLYKFARIYKSNSLFHAYLDDRTTKHTPERMRSMLNARVKRELKLGYEPFRVCQFRKSHHVKCIQLADILSGAIAYATNRHDLKLDAATHKTELVKHIATLAKLPSLAMPTRYSPDGFDIWHIDFTKSRR